VPLIADGNRDPKIIRSPLKKHWVMALYLTGTRYALLSSVNLLDWALIQELDLPEDSECPDFYPLPAWQNRVELSGSPDAADEERWILCGAADEERWILCGAADRYQVGTFDGLRFIPEGSVKRLHYGSHSYAAQSWSNLPETDGRRIRIAWNTFDIPGMPFNKCMTTPCEMTLRKLGDELVLCTWPIREVDSLHRNIRTETNLAITPETPFKIPLERCTHDLFLSFRNTAATGFTFSLFGLDIVCDGPKGQLTCLDKTAPFESRDGTSELRLIMDTTGVELYLNGGSAYLSMGFLADWNLNHLEIRPTSGPVEITRLTVAELPKTLLFT
jgi:levanase/fructan beta-fructosidase